MDNAFSHSQTQQIVSMQVNVVFIAICLDLVYVLFFKLIVCMYICFVLYVLMFYSIKLSMDRPSVHKNLKLYHDGNAKFLDPPLPSTNCTSM